MLCRVPCGGGGGGGGGAESFALSCSPKHVRAPIVLPRSHNGQAGNLQHDRRRGHRRRPHGPHDVAILLYDPPVLSPRSPPSLCAACGTCGPAGAKQLARERESSTAGSEALRWQRSTTLPAKQDSEPFVLCVLGAVLPLVSHPLVLSLAPSPRWRAPANTWKDGKLTSSPSEWFSKYQGLSSASRAQN